MCMHTHAKDPLVCTLTAFRSDEYFSVCEFRLQVYFQLITTHCCASEARSHLSKTMRKHGLNTNREIEIDRQREDEIRLTGITSELIT